jgi:hypothetical protein
MHGSDNLIHETKDFIELRGSPSLVGRGIANPQEYRLTANVVDFQSFLKAQKKRNVRQIMSYAQRYHSVLETGDATPLVSLQSGAVRRHAMEALAAYAKCNGSYDKWQQIRQRYSLHWTNGDESVQALQRFFNSELSLDKMFSRLKEMAHKLPPPMGQIVRFGTLTGLRPAEILESVRLIIDDDDNQTFQKYYDSKQMVLQHWKFPDIFLRSTKKAFVSFVSPEIVQNVKIHVPHIPSYSAIRHVCSRNGMACDLRFCRKVHGSWLHEHNVSAEEIDFLQGRARTSVFIRHYLTPGDSLRTRVLDALK